MPMKKKLKVDLLPNVNNEQVRNPESKKTEAQLESYIECNYRDGSGYSFKCNNCKQNCNQDNIEKHVLGAANHMKNVWFCTYCQEKEANQRKAMECHIILAHRCPRCQGVHKDNLC